MERSLIVFKWKCKVLLLGKTRRKAAGDGPTLRSSSTEHLAGGVWRGGGNILVDKQNVSQQCTLVAKLTNSILDYLSRRVVNS